MGATRPAAGICAALAALAGCHHRPPAGEAPSVPESRWARQTLARLTLEEKAGQVIGLRATAYYANPESDQRRRLRDELRRTRAGIVVLFEAEAAAVAPFLASLRRETRLPLLVAADLERGAGFRIRRGPASLPSAMAVGATRSEDDARAMGEITAREARALGIRWALAPVADVNSNPRNPIINVRSFGEEPALVGRLAAAFVRGLRQGGVLATAKHFPGHGDTVVDSHLRLPTVAADRLRLEAVELAPFRQVLAAGADAVMTAHLAVPALDPTGTPASLSPEVTTRLLREEMGFQGLVATDALDMAGAKAAWQGDAVVRAVAAGADVVLLPSDPVVAHQSLVRAVREGVLPARRLDDAVLRVLAAKERLGLHRDARPPALDSGVGRPADVERGKEIARASITVPKNERGLLPLRAEAPLRLLHLSLTNDPLRDPGFALAEEEVERRRIPQETLWLGPDLSAETADALVDGATAFTHILASCFVRARSASGLGVELTGVQVALLRRLAAVRPVILVSFGSPYALAQVPEASAAIAAYGWAESSQEAAMEAVFGEHPVAGQLPVSLPPLYRVGEGVKIPRREMALRVAAPEDVGFRANGLAEADRVLERALAAKAFPGGVLAVGRDSALVRLAPFGRQTYDAAAPAVAPDTIYDLASLTKIVVTNTAAMILADEDKLDLGAPVSAFVPGFRGDGKERVTVEQLLSHSGGLEWWAPLYKDSAGREQFLARILEMPLAYPPGSKSVYSDLGLILLGEVLERVAGEPLDAFARRRILDPLGMKDTGYRPPESLRPRIAPTERDPWRGRLLQGEVHDENAAALGGVAPHAGLFGTAADLARFAQMMLNGGVYDHHRLVSRETVDRFTTLARVPGSDRALGWQKPSGGNSAGSRLSPAAYGHTGFTGTSLWIDPERRLFVVLLTNRVHPTRDNDAIRQVRRDLMDAVVGALQEP
jgi:beta-glucosidase-like glycosyl hydrolase/CubicO group peptidase (beta-lactamase class C family)